MRQSFVYAYIVCSLFRLTDIVGGQALRFAYLPIFQMMDESEKATTTATPTLNRKPWNLQRIEAFAMKIDG